MYMTLVNTTQEKIVKLLLKKETQIAMTTILTY